MFGGLNDEDVDLIAKELYTGELDPEQIKDEIWHRGFEPVLSTRTIRANSSSESDGSSYLNPAHSTVLQRLRTPC